jgi:polyphosphate kinase 2
MGKKKGNKLGKKAYEEELARLQLELSRLQDWVVQSGAKVLVIFEGRDTAGKGGLIKRITENVSPRVFRVVALPAPNDQERTQFYFQRYAAHLPSAGQVVIFDRSWYNRAGVEKVMGFCTDEQYEEFFRICPGWERALIGSGIILIKYFLVVSPKQQLKRFEARISDRTKQWKLSPLDVKARDHWYDYSRGYDRMFDETDTAEAPWNLVKADDKKKARLNCITHLLDQIPFKQVEPPTVELPPLQDPDGFDTDAMFAKRKFVREAF